LNLVVRARARESGMRVCAGPRLRHLPSTVKGRRLACRVWWDGIWRQGEEKEENGGGGGRGGVGEMGENKSTEEGGGLAPMLLFLAHRKLV
jgi:hypothetical protein